MVFDFYSLSSGRLVEIAPRVETSHAFAVETQLLRAMRVETSLAVETRTLEVRLNSTRDESRDLSLALARSRDLAEGRDRINNSDRDPTSQSVQEFVFNTRFETYIRKYAEIIRSHCLIL
jgi:hypothetical protein